MGTGYLQLARTLRDRGFAMESIATSRETNRIFPPSRTRTVSALALPKVLLCDLDGTLIDTMPVLADLATEVMVGMYGVPKTLARELYLATCGLPFIAQLEDIFPGDARNREASNLFEDMKPARCGSARMPADTLAALADLKQRGV